MSMPKDFSEDGAFGANGGGDPGSGTFGTGTASSGPISDTDAVSRFGAGALDNGALGTPNGYQPPNQVSDATAASRFGAGALGEGNLGMSFSDGGAIDDTDGSPAQDRISKALGTVDSVLAFGRKLHGLGGNEEDDGTIPGAQAGAMPMIPGNQSETPGPYRPGQGGQTMAANMPSVPGSQSNSGQRPPQPMPGPLPPTSNPFGKRADAGDGDGDDDDQGGAINTDEETA